MGCRSVPQLKQLEGMGGGGIDEQKQPRDCNFQATDSRHGRCAGLPETPMCEARIGSKEMRLMIFLLHIYSLIGLNQTNSS